jgi:hypothetical protein
MTIRRDGVFVVIPSNRRFEMRNFADAWVEDLKDVTVIVVEDNPVRSFDLPDEYIHVSWAEIDQDLGSKSWIIPRRTSAIRSYGTYLAYKMGADIIWHLDDDCYPEELSKGIYLGFLEDNFSKAWPDGRWWNTIHGTGLYPRGYPYQVKATIHPTMVHHGLWSNIPDLDGITQLENPDFRLPPCNLLERVPYGQSFPMCGMNLAFRRQAAPLMYMLLQGKDYPYDRFDDMWCGLFMKRVADHLNWAVTSGRPSIHHSRASDAARNAAVEAPGILAHEKLWQEVENVSLAGCTTASECYLQFAEMIRERAANQAYPDYWFKLSGAMRRWTELFQKELC